MKSFFKKLAFVMALALVLGTTAQAGTAKAAEAWKFQKDSKILYLNEDNSSKTGSTYDFNFAKGTLPANWKDTLSFAWGSSDTKVATVAKGGVVTAVSVGKTTISCVVTEKATGKTVATAEAVVTVKENAADIQITNADKYDNTTVAIGDVVDLDRAMYNAAGQKTTKRGTLVTDYTKWVAEPAEGVTINQNNGQYTFTKAGTYTLYAYAYQSKTNDAVRAVSNKVVVTVADAGFEVAQKTPTKVQLTFAGEVTDINKDDVSVFMLIGETESKVDVATVKVLDSKVDVAVETYVPFQDGYNYVVKFGENEETFKASVGKVAKIELATKLGNKAYAETDTKIVATYKDANDVDVSSIYANSAVFEWEYENSATSDFFFDEGNMSIYFYEANKVAVLKGTYISGDYDDNGNAINNVPATITVVSEKAPTVTVSGIEKWSFKNDKVVSYDAVNGSSLTQQIAEGDPSVYLHVITKDSAGNKLASSDTNVDYSFIFKSSNEEVALVNPTTGKFTPVAAGNVNIIVYYKANNDAQERAIDVVNVKVSPVRTATRLTLGETSAVLAWNEYTLADGTTNTKKDEKYVTITVKDGLGADFIDKAKLDVVSNTTGGEGIFSITADNKLYIDPTAAVMTKDGKPSNDESVWVSNKTFTATVTADKLSAKFTLTVRKADKDANPQYKLEITNNVDTTIKDGESSLKSVSIKLFGYTNSVKLLEKKLEFTNKASNDYAATATVDTYFYTVTKGTDLQPEQYNDGKDNTFTLTSVTPAESVTVTGSSICAISDNFDDVSVVEKKGEGTYAVTVYKVVEKNGKNIASRVTAQNFSVTDDQPVIKYSIDKVTTAETDILKAVRDCIKFSVGGAQVTDDKIKDYPITVYYSENGNKLYVNSVTLYVPYEVKDKDKDNKEYQHTVYIKQDISIKKTITIGQK